ncbi:hypothetical protein L484_016141 [Morus notabilis]|uniref:Uncharacterized protein n=1 Tax=Morus notabilis TaxID=981085 RepID=W9QWI3_9ROSA|nr:hypothetical protein L484_016141 [Morus notabilis]
MPQFVATNIFGRFWANRATRASGGSGSSGMKDLTGISGSRKFVVIIDVRYSYKKLKLSSKGWLGAFMAASYGNLLPADSRKSLNKIVFAVFTALLMFASQAKAVKLEDTISWCFVPVNIGFTFLFGGILGGILVKILRPKAHHEGLIVATCSSGISFVLSFGCSSCASTQ